VCLVRYTRLPKPIMPLETQSSVISIQTDLCIGIGWRLICACCRWDVGIRYRCQFQLTIAARIFNSFAVRIGFRLALSDTSVLGTLGRAGGLVVNGGIRNWSKRQLRASAQRRHRRCETSDLTTGIVEGSKLLLILYCQALNNPMFMNSVAKTQAEHTKACICNDSLPNGCSQWALVSLRATS